MTSVRLLEWCKTESGEKILAQVATASHDGEGFVTYRGDRVSVCEVMEDECGHFSVKPGWYFL